MRVNRRTFIAAGAATIAIGPRGLWSSPSPNRALNIACVGVGGRGWDNLHGVAGESIVALCDVDLNHLEKAADKFPKAATFADYRKMLESPDTIDAVVVSTPDHMHAPIAAMAMKLGKHVYVEKPLTHSIHEARTLARLAAEKKVVTQMGNQGHAGNGVREIKEVIDAGTIGKVSEVHAWTDRPIWPQGIDRPETKPAPDTVFWDLWLGVAPERPYHDHLHPFSWRGWWDFGTGALGDMACHIMDPLYYALAPGFPTRVEAEGGPRKDETAPNWETVRMEFPTVKVSWYDGKKEDGSRNLPPADLVPGVELDKISGGSIFVGEKGTLFCPSSYGETWKLVGVDGFKPPAPTIPRVEGGHHDEFVRACKGEGTTGSHFGYAGPFTEMVLIGVVAYRTGKALDWNAEEMKATNAPEAAPFVKREYRKGWE